jgi:glucose-1-phosphate adenylyltransferase
LYLKTTVKVVLSLYRKPAAALLPDWESEVSWDQMKSEGKLLLLRWGFIYSIETYWIDLMSNPDTKDFGKEIIPQAVGIKKY